MLKKGMALCKWFVNNIKMFLTFIFFCVLQVLEKQLSNLNESLLNAKVRVQSSFSKSSCASLC